jgi:hypothetical protein
VKMEALMRQMWRYVGVVLVLSPFLLADSNLRITDVGLDGYNGTPCAVRLVVRNPSSQPQLIHLRVAVLDGWAITNAITSDVDLNGSEERELELPALTNAGETKITADAFAADGSVLGHDVYAKSLRSGTLVVLMCASQNTCQGAQSQIEFSGSIQERADKNRNLRFEVSSAPREDWWAYTPASAVVLAMPVTKFSADERNALEGYLRRGGRLVLVEDEIADSEFLSAYRKGSPGANGERVAKGTLFRVSGLGANQLGGVFAGRNLPPGLGYFNGATTWQRSLAVSWLRQRFSTSFHFPRLRWILVWLAAYILMIGVVNFAVLRRLRRLEFGWISMCGLALLFAAGFYFSSASRRPKQFRLDNLAIYYLDSQSPVAAADYELRLSAPERQDVLVSVADPALITSPMTTDGESNGHIWSEMNRQVAPSTRGYDIRLGPPRQVQLSLLKWSFVDMNLEGLHQFPGTVHLVGPDRLRNDTGLHFGETVYFDGRANAIYDLPGLDIAQEIQLGAIPHKSIVRAGQRAGNPNPDPRTATLEELALGGLLPFAGEQQVLAGFSDGAALPVGLNISRQENMHSLIIVVLEQP